MFRRQSNLLLLGRLSEMVERARCRSLLTRAYLTRLLVKGPAGLMRKGTTADKAETYVVDLIVALKRARKTVVYAKSRSTSSTRAGRGVYLAVLARAGLDLDASELRLLGVPARRWPSTLASSSNTQETWTGKATPPLSLQLPGQPQARQLRAR